VMIIEDYSDSIDEWILTCKKKKYF
jgi:hypothetical protein